MTIDENIAYWKSKEVPMDSTEDEEHEAPKEEGSGPSNSSKHPVDHEEEVEGPSDPMDLVPQNKKRIAWLRSTLQEAEGCATPHGTFKGNKRTKRYFGYETLMTNLIDYEPSTFEEVAIEQV